MAGTTARSPFVLTVYDKTFTRKGWIGAPVSVEAHVRHNALSHATITVDADHPRVVDLVQPGARMTLDYDDGFLMSGRVGTIEGKGPRMQSTVTVTIESDFRLLSRLLGWPNPLGAVTEQGADTAYDTKTGPAETVFKWFVTRNAGRSTPPITVAADSARGNTITVSMRMHQLADRLLPVIDQAGIGVDVRQQGAGLTVYCYQPVVRPQVLSEATGIVTDWSWTATAPAATDVVVGGQGEGTAREFLLVNDPARRAEWAESIEVFRDARDTEDPDIMVRRGEETLAEGAPTTGLSLTLAESKGWRYGKSVRVGDLVTTQIAPGAAITDVLREATLKWDREQGLTVTPVVGDRAEDPAETLRATINALARGIRDLRAR